MWNLAKRFYNYLLTFPDRLYPFSEKNEKGEELTGEKAYRYIFEKNKRRFMDPFSLKSPKLLLWRALFQFLGSVFLVVIANQMFKYVSFFNGFAFLVLVVLAVAVQEFYIHPHYYKQKPTKGIIDFATWMLPILLYILL